MNQDKKRAVKKQRNAWVQGHTMEVPQQLCAFEVDAKRLGLNSENTEQCKNSSEMVLWVNKNKDSKYVPTVLLFRLHLRTVYDGGDFLSAPKFEAQTVHESEAQLEPAEV